MPTPVPTPVAAALGIVPTVLGHVRRLPAKAVQLPIFAVSSALTGIDSARREYEDMAARGERLLARLRGTSLDELEDRVEASLQGTPLAAPYDKVEDALEDAADTVTALIRKAPAAAKTAPAKARQAAGSTARAAGERLDRAADTVEDLAGEAERSLPQQVEQAADGVEQGVAAVARAATDTVERAADTVEQGVEQATGAARQAARTADVKATDAQTPAPKAADATASLTAELNEAATPADEQPKGAPTPKATEPPAAHPDTAASAPTVAAVERVSAVVGGPVLEHDELPLADYDHMTLGSLRGRLRSLDVPQLVQLRDYEKAHADRLPIITMLDNRIAKLVADPTAPLSGGGRAGQAPGTADTSGGAKAAPATAAPAPNNPTVAFGGLGGVKG